MPIDNVVAVNAAILTLNNALQTGYSALSTPPSTSAEFSGFAAAITAAVAAIQTLLEVAGLDSDLIAQQIALKQAISAGNEALNAALKAIAVATPGSTWPPDAGANAIAGVWRD